MQLLLAVMLSIFTRLPTFRDRSDLFSVTALNKNFRLFRCRGSALHFYMCQLSTDYKISLAQMLRYHCRRSSDFIFVVAVKFCISVCEIYLVLLRSAKLKEYSWS